jgi:alpha-L-fucosidase
MAGKEPVTVHVADGVYYLPDTLVLTAADSGTEDSPVVWQAEHEGKAVVSGGMKLSLPWQPYRDGIFKAATPPGLPIDQLFVNGQCQRMARYPNFDPAKSAEPYQGWAADAISKERAARWADPAGGFIHAMHKHTWGGYHYRITGKKPNGELDYEGGWQNNRQLGMHDNHRMVENIFEELDAPGEWFLDARTSTLYFYPPVGVDLSSATIEVVRLRHLVEFRGTQPTPVRFVTFQGFTFRHAARTFMDTREPLLRSDWTIYRGGAVVLTGTEQVRILDCEFDQPGGNAVFVSRYNRQALIKGCHIHDTGASGVCFVGDPAAVRNPLFEYGENQDLTKIDRTPGPKTEDYPANCAVEDCLIHGIGRVERQPAGVQISMSSRIAVRDTSVYDCARAGINIRDGCWGGHLIERCDVFDTVLETGDHGSFNSWGRDRYWNGNHRGISEPEVKKDPKLPYLDAVEPIVIRDSRWRCDHGWDIDLDDGSSNFQIYNNLFLKGGLKFREGYGRKAWNNVLVNCGFHPHVWFADSGSEFRHNIVMAAHAPVVMPPGWGKAVDANLFSSEDLIRRNESDTNSISGDPLFMDPAKGDYRVREESLALKLGFKNFAMDRFGVKKATLKSKARMPVIPDVRIAAQGGTNASAPILQYWLGALLHGLEGEQFSAFGVNKNDMGVQLREVPEDSPAAKAGLRKNDIVQQLNGRATPNTAALFAALTAAGGSPLTVSLVRSQQAMEVALGAMPPMILFDDTWRNGWFEAGSTGNASQQKITHSGGKSIELLMGPTATIFNCFNQAPVPVAGYGSVSFWVNGGEQGGQKLKVYLKQGGENGPTDIQELPPLVKGVWQRIVLPLDRFKDEHHGTQLGMVMFQGDGDLTPWFIDDISIDPVTGASANSMPMAETPSQHDARMRWWREARFGMFVHWNVSSVLAGRYRDQPSKFPLSEWIMHSERIPMGEYQSLASKFNPVSFDADALVRLAKSTGMKYLVITAKHHDGFAMFATKASRFNIVDATPYGKDPLQALASACRTHGIRLGFYYSQAQDWNNGGATDWGNGRAHWDPDQLKPGFDAYLERVALPQVKELLTNYGEFPDILWWDTPADMTPDRARPFLSLVKSSKPGLILNNRLSIEEGRAKDGLQGDTETPEGQIPTNGYPGRDWETCMTMNHSWGYRADDHAWKSAREHIRNLCDIASKGGNYLLNVGPTAEGLVPPECAERLQAIGAWMAVNGSSIHGTSAGPFKTQLTWGRVTQKNSTLFLHVFDWPANGKLLVPMATTVRSARLLAQPDNILTTSQTPAGVVVHVGSIAPDPDVSVVALEMDDWVAQ